MRKFFEILREAMRIVLSIPFVVVYFIGLFILLIAGIGMGIIGYIFDR